MVLTRHELIANELNYINNPRIQQGMEEIVNLLPAYFFTVPTSATGKYHPKFSGGKGGLLRHCKAAMKIGYDLFGNSILSPRVSEDGADLILVAIFIHDGLKLGLPQENTTRWDHPILMQKFLLDNEAKIPSLTHDELVFMGDIISTHMGEWVYDKSGKKVLEEPVTQIQKFVHLCDYISSRKAINFEFDENWNIVIN